MLLVFQIFLFIFQIFIFAQTLYILDETSFDDFHLTTSKISKLSKQKRETTPESEFIFHIILENNKTEYTVHIKPRNCDLLVENKTVFVDLFNTSERRSHLISEYFKEYNGLFEGFIENLLNNSSVNGYLKNGNFYGHIIVDNKVYYVDELREHHLIKHNNKSITDDNTIAERNALIFKRDSVTTGVLLAETFSAKKLFRSLIAQHYFMAKFKQWKQQGMICSMIVVIDNSFLKIVHNFNKEAAIFHILFSLEEANSIFRTTDFDGDGIPDNIGFYIKKIVVMLNDTPTDYLPEYQKDELHVMDYIIKFMRYEKLSEYCLGIVFTAQKFAKSTLGASYTPDSTSLHPTTGICDGTIKSIGTMNSLVITAATSRYPLVNQIIFEATIAHELGHSFGAPHDESIQCSAYLMSPKSHSNYFAKKSHLMFSQCSKEHILRTLVLKGECFDAVETPFCGNGIIEDGEECDCGLTRDCLLKDPCCTPRRTGESPCRINKKKGFQCHPSQGECCTRNCLYNLHLWNFLDCKNLDKTCPCKNNEENCLCGLNGACINNECHSIECTRLGLRECSCYSFLKTPQKLCQICCQLGDDCIPALEATNSIILSKEISPQTSGYKSKQFIVENFCHHHRCSSLQFLKGKPGEYCLERGKLGKCQTSFKCEIAKIVQTFPSFENGSAKFTITKIVLYFCVNKFLIDLLMK